VERALAEALLSLVAHPFDRGAVTAGMKPICAPVAAACAEQRASASPRAPRACWSWSTPSRVHASPSACQADAACCHACAPKGIAL